MKLAKKVLIADKEEQWLNFAKKALRAAEFDIDAISDYGKLLPTMEEKLYGLVIIGFTDVNDDELQMISKVVLQKPSQSGILIVTTIELSLDKTRDLLFGLGVDVTRKPFTAMGLVRLVAEEWKWLQRPLSSYQKEQTGDFVRE